MGISHAYNSITKGKKNTFLSPLSLSSSASFGLMSRAGFLPSCLQKPEMPAASDGARGLRAWEGSEKNLIWMGISISGRTERKKSEYGETRRFHSPDPSRSNCLVSASGYWSWWLGQFSVVFLRYFILHGCTDEYSLPKEKGKIWDHSFSFLSTLEIAREGKKVKMFFPNTFLSWKRRSSVRQPGIFMSICINW